MIACLAGGLPGRIPHVMHGALRDGNQNALAWHLIHVLEKLEQGVEQGSAFPRMPHLRRYTNGSKSKRGPITLPSTVPTAFQNDPISPY